MSGSHKLLFDFKDLHAIYFWQDWRVRRRGTLCRPSIPSRHSIKYKRRSRPVSESAAPVLSNVEWNKGIEFCEDFDFLSDVAESKDVEPSRCDVS